MTKKYIDTNNGGSIYVNDNNIVLDLGIFTPIYLKMFSTKSPFWGNETFNIDLDSKTQKALTSNSLDPEGIENIKRAVIEDLNKLDFADFEVFTKIVNENRLRITIDAKDNGKFVVVWDNENNQLTEYGTI